MAGPIDKTMQVLASTANSRALDVLIEALHAERPDIQRAGVVGLIKRKSSRGQLEVIRHLPQLCTEARSSLETQIEGIDDALRQALLHGDEELQSHALELIRSTENFGQVPVLLEMLKVDRADVSDRAAETMRDLVDRLFEHGHQGRGSRHPDRYLRNAAQVKHNVLTGFDRALSHFDELTHQQDVVEGVLILGGADNFAVKKALVQNGADCRRLAGSVLMSSKHPGVMQLIVDYLSKNYPPPKVFEVVSQRDDLEFASHLLRWMPDTLTPQQQKSLQQLNSIAWIDPDRLSLERFAPALQPALVAFVTASGLSSDVKLKVDEWIVRHGTPEGRLAASNVLGSIDSSTAQEIVTSSLESEDEEIQAWATGQLRNQGVPEALSILVDRLDSPLSAVREAAREELAGFGITTMLEIFEKVSPVVCRRAGQLIRKIDPDCLGKLRQELMSPIRRNRIRAARAARLLGMHNELLPSLLDLLEDNDPQVCRTAISTLATIRTPETIEAISELLDHENPRVREDAVRALANMQPA